LQLAADRADAVAERRAAIAALAQRVGPDVTSDSLAALVDVTAREHRFEDWLTLIGHRPPADSLLGWSDALRAARADQQRAAAQQRLVTAEQRSQWNGVAGVQRIGPDNGGPSMGIVLGLSSTLPFTARRGLLASRAAADSLAFAADANALAANVQANATLQAAFAHDDAAQERVRILHGALSGATAGERDAALAHYRNGEITLLELLDFERALLRVEVERARAISAAAAARAALFGLDQ
jgi:outer membrane protein TolC